MINPNLSMEALVELINASSDNLRLVVLNNCFSSIISEKIVDNIEASIGMNSSIGDQAAIVFASQLYSSIGVGLILLYIYISFSFYYLYIYNTIK